MDDTLNAYLDGRRDGIAGARDPRRSADPDYRIGFLDGRIEVFRMHTHVRRIVEDSGEGYR